MTDSPDPPFTQDFTIEQVESGSIKVRHRDGSWWRFDLAEKNGRLQLLHADYRSEPASSKELTAKAVDAYDTATREARRRGMVD